MCRTGSIETTDIPIVRICRHSNVSTPKEQVSVSLIFIPNVHNLWWLQIFLSYCGESLALFQWKTEQRLISSVTFILLVLLAAVCFVNVFRLWYLVCPYLFSYQ